MEEEETEEEEVRRLTRATTNDGRTDDGRAPDEGTGRSIGRPSSAPVVRDSHNLSYWHRLCTGAGSLSSVSFWACWLVSQFLLFEEPRSQLTFFLSLPWSIELA